MTEDVKKLLTNSPFMPFIIVTSGGNKYPVPTPDHADVSPSGKTVNVWFDDDGSVIVTGDHIASIERSKDIS